MDFDSAARRLKTDHAKLKARNQKSRTMQKLASDKAASKNQKLQEFRQAQLLAKKKRELVQKRVSEYGVRIVNKAERRLGVTKLEGQDGRASLELDAESVHGQGDKITLPSSVLSILAERDLLSANQERGQPLFFRLGIKRNGYVFPTSKKMKELIHEYEKKLDTETENDTKADDDYMSDDDKDESHEDTWMTAYLEELESEYVSYTYATVIEFSQEEGHIGLPSSVSSALLQTRHNESSEGILSKVTTDPASVTSLSKDEMDVDQDEAMNNVNDEPLESKTPGHAAYGLFPVPSSSIDVTLVTHIPLGTKCTLQPTSIAIENGFYGLKNIKLALEQSLIRTRGCLNLKDVVPCWFRGKRFDLTVTEVVPSTVEAVSCVNTDVEVDIAAADVDKKSEEKPKALISTPSTGYRLSDNRSNTVEPDVDDDALHRQLNLDLPPEPVFSEQSSNVITIQIRGEGGKVTSKRRFDSTLTSVKHIFSFAASENIFSGNVNSFHLVTRFPRRVISLSTDGETRLTDIGLNIGREMLLIEKA